MFKRILCLLTISVPACGWAQSAALPDSPYVSTSASAVEEVAPDFAVLSMQFRTVQDAPDAVRTRTDEAQHRLIDVLEDFDEAIREQRVESMRFGEEFEFDRQRGERTKVGHFGEFTVRLEVDDFDKLPDLHYRLAGLQWRSLANPQFRVDDREAAENRLREQALVKARERARSLAEAGGASLGALWGVIHQPMHDLAGRLLESGSARGPAVSLAAAEGQQRFALAMEPRPIRFEVTVGVVYRIRPEGSE
ncbi:MAG: SIMPL domain-containing protein [Candidatus Wenzhouxiangella sp. M2_3B_020]